MEKLEHLTEWEIEGYWWLPEQPDKKLAGRLVYTAGDKMDLHLFGAFTEFRGMPGITQ